MSQYQIDVKLCSGEGCLHRYRCYRHSLYNDALYKSNTFQEVDSKECVSPSDEDVESYKYMWLPNNVPTV